MYINAEKAKGNRDDLKTKVSELKTSVDAIKTYLTKKGVSASALTTDGKGGTQPVANPKDKDNNWKNRRVEFILQK